MNAMTEWWARLKVDPVALGGAVERLSGHVLDYAIALAAVGTITMALLELAKATTGARPRYHRRRIDRWLGAATAAKAQLLRLASGGEENSAALCDQPTDAMMRHIRAAANVAMDFPHVYSALYTFLTSAAADADVQAWRLFAEVTPGDTAQAKRADATGARVRLGNLVARRLDAFQNRTEYVWARLNQTVAVVAGAALLFSLLPAQSGAMEISPVARVSVALVGGMIAPVAKDVVTALTGLRGKR